MSKDYSEYILLCECGHKAEICSQKTKKSIRYWVQCSHCGKEAPRHYSTTRAVLAWNKEMPKALEKERTKQELIKFNKKRILKMQIHQYCEIIRHTVPCRECPLNDTAVCISETPTVFQLEEAIKICERKYGVLKNEKINTDSIS